MTKRIAGFSYSPRPAHKLDLVETDFYARFNLGADGSVARSYALRTWDHTPGITFDGFPTLGTTKLYRLNLGRRFLAYTDAPEAVARRVEAHVVSLFADYEVVAARFMGALRAASADQYCPLDLYFHLWLDTQDEWKVRYDTRIQLIQNANAHAEGDLLRSWSSPTPDRILIYAPPEFDARNPLFASLARVSANYDQELLDFTESAGREMTQFIHERLAQLAKT